jgi:hypothetical protein
MPDEDTRLKADASWRVGASPLLMRCPACGKRFTLSDAGVVEVEPEDGTAPG